MSLNLNNNQNRYGKIFAHDHVRVHDVDNQHHFISFKLCKLNSVFCLSGVLGENVFCLAGCFHILLILLWLQSLWKENVILEVWFKGA